MNFSEKFLKKLEEAKSLVFFTGAGISAESGIPTFRGAGGIWNKLKPEELANFDAFLKNPEMVWEWYQYRRKIVEEAEPNDGHKVIAELEKYYNVTVVTQNVDNLHRRGGSNTVYELHGNIERNFCIDCGKFFEIEEVKFDDKTPRCPECGGLVRPDVVWFGEMLPQDVFSAGEKAAANSDICFVVGTSAIVYPAAYIPITARESGALIVEVNIEETDLSRYADYSFFGEAGKIMPEILKEVKGFKQEN